MITDIRYGVRTLAKSPAIGVRMALGAQSGAVLRLVLGRGLWLVATGLTAGMGLAFVMTWAIPANLLPNVSPRDPATFAVTCALLGFVALLASGIPAWRATRIDPLRALRVD